MNAGELRTEAKRSQKCRQCGMRGDAGSGQNLYWYVHKDNPSIRMMIHGNSNGPTSYGIVHMTTCREFAGWRVKHNIEHPMTFDQLVAAGIYGTNSVSQPTEPTPERSEPTEPTSPVVADLDLTDIKQELLDEIERKVEETFATHRPTVVEVRNPVGEVTYTGLTHKMFPKVLRALQAGCHVWLTGPAGTGKSQLAQQCAEALGMSFGSLPLSVTTPVTEIVGYRDANGAYHDTSFRRVYDCGGVFLFDEVDNGNPNTLVKVNEALANGGMEFPDQRIVKHDTTKVLAAGNTYGTGADAQYVGRMQLDAAFLDRFVFVEIGVDEALETAITQAQGASSDDVEWILGYVRRCRANAQTMRLKVVISPRASMNGAKLLAAGFTRNEVVSMAVRKGISEQDWAKVSEGAWI